MPDILTRIVEDKREEIAALQRRLPLERVREEAAARRPALPLAPALRGARPRGTGRDARIISELKLRSPSKGVFRWHGDVARQVTDYVQGGASAISVVTDGKHFGGSPELVRQVKALVAIPVLQKEFLLEPYQVHYARSLGADAALLIAAILEGGRLAEMIGLAREIGLSTLVEVVDEQEFARAAQAGAEVIGVNNRDLRTFTVDLNRTLRLVPLCRDEHVLVAESGIHGRAEVERLMAGGVDAFLIGEALMTARHPAEMLAALRGVAPAAAPKAASQAAAS
jgi:indole-3-glycerol phosphate synthase